MQDHFHQLHRFYWKLKIEEVLDGPDIDDCENYAGLLQSQLIFMFLSNWIFSDINRIEFE